jgi:hypothetical protein
MSIPNPSASYCKELENLFFFLLLIGMDQLIELRCPRKKYEDGGR